jgi:hypothetical protein
MSLSNYTVRALLAGMFSKSTGNNFGDFDGAPANFFIGLSTADPTETGGSDTPPSGNGYARVSTAPSDWGNPTDADPSVITTTSDVDFPTPTGSWGTVTHITIYDASTAGNFLAGAALDSSRAITTDDAVSFAAGDITVTLD